MPSGPYCGGKPSPPRGRAMATDADACRRQIRAFGRRVVDPGMDARHAPTARALLAGGEPGGRSPRGRPQCGAINGRDARQSDCTRQFRRFGLLPIVEDRDDLRSRSFVWWPALADGGGQEDLPRLPTIKHAYPNRVYRGESAHSRGKPLVAVSVGVDDDDDDDSSAAAGAWAADPTRTPGGVGLAFGYFSDARPTFRTFQIVHTHVNPPYRRGSGASEGPEVSSWVVEKLVAAVVRRARGLAHARGVAPPARILLQIDENAPCFKLGDPKVMKPAQWAALGRMYEGAGFERHDLVGGRNWHTMRRVVTL